MTLSTKTLRCVAIVAAIVTVCMRASRAWGQDAPMHVSCQVAKLTAAQVEEIAKLKMPDLNTVSLESAMSMVKGTARSMGIEIK